MKNLEYPIGRRTSDLLACSSVPQPTALTRSTYMIRASNDGKDSYCAGMAPCSLVRIHVKCLSKT